MIISLIAAVAENNAIGKNNDLLWSLPADMKFFKETTKGHCVVTGRKNYESIPEKYRPLPGRPNLIITRNTNYKAPGAHIFEQLSDAIAYAKAFNEQELFIIGGGEIYQQSIMHADKMYITKVHARFEADTFFPEISDKEWVLTQQEPHVADEKHAYNFTFCQYTRRK